MGRPDLTARMRLRTWARLRREGFCVSRAVLYPTFMLAGGTLLPNLDSAGNSRMVTLGPQDVLSGVFGIPVHVTDHQGRLCVSFPIDGAAQG